MYDSFGRFPIQEIHGMYNKEIGIIITLYCEFTYMYVHHTSTSAGYLTYTSSADQPVQSYSIRKVPLH